MVKSVRMRTAITGYLARFIFCFFTVVKPNTVKYLISLGLILSTTAYTFSQSGSWSFRKENRPDGKSAMEKVAVIIGKDPGGKEVVLATERDTKEVSDGDTTSISDSYSIVSYAGPYLTLLHKNFEYMHGAAHPNVRRLFEVIDARTGKTKLTDFYSEQQIFDVLLKDKFILSSLAEGAKPGSLAELFASLETNCEVEFSDGMLGSFAFHHVEPGKVAIRIGLPNSCAVANGGFTQLGAFFTIPEKLKVWLPAAASGKTLMRDLLPKISQYE
jgi:hypothetical protein